MDWFANPDATGVILMQNETCQSASILPRKRSRTALVTDSCDTVVGTTQSGNNNSGETNVRVILYGATGKSGRVILKELVDRGHTVIAAARTPEKVQKFTNVSVAQDDLTDPTKTAGIVKEAAADAVVSAYGPSPDDTAQLIAATDCLIGAIKKSGGSRLIVVGGAGSLFVAPGVTLRNSGRVPKEWIPIVDAHIETFRRLRESGINWTYFSPAAHFSSPASGRANFASVKTS